MKNLTESTSTLILEVGEFILNAAENFSKENIEEKSLNSLVSYVDKEAEMQLVNGLKQILPEAGFLTEEETVSQKNKTYTWVIDPLDGTTNFMHGVPVFSISVALLKEGEETHGWVYELGRRELFFAEKGKGASLNGKPIHVNDEKALSNSLLATGFPYYDFSKIDSYLLLLRSFFKKTRGVRRMGSAAVDLAYVACGRFDAFFEYSLNPWDVAAGALIVKEAGGKVSTFNPGKNYLFDKEIVAYSAEIEEEFLEEIKRHLD